jgi:hypothetical protein
VSHQLVTALSANEKQALLGRLEAMQIEPAGAERTFVSRLAEENGWSLGFAARVMTEYRRFLFLAATTDHQVTPSDEVDQAWHLHLAYTRHYWANSAAASSAGRCIMDRQQAAGPRRHATGINTRRRCRVTPPPSAPSLLATSGRVDASVSRALIGGEIG